MQTLLLDNDEYPEKGTASFPSILAEFNKHFISDVLVEWYTDTG